MCLKQMKKFTQSRKSQRTVETVVQGKQVPLYGGIPVLVNTIEHLDRVAVPLNLTFVMRSRAYILGRLVKSKFYGRFRCSVTLRGNKLGKPLNLTDSCMYLWLLLDALRLGCRLWIYIQIILFLQCNIWCVFKDFMEEKRWILFISDWICFHRLILFYKGSIYIAFAIG